MFEKKILLAIFTIPFLLTACTQTVSSEESSAFRDLFPTSDETDFENTYEAELYYNYVMLDLLYLYAHTRGELDPDYRVYLGKGTSEVNEVKGYCTANFFDVCYMYNQMADPFTQYFDPYIADQVLSAVMESETIIGIGAEVEPISDSTSTNLRITAIYPKSPSEKAGLQEGDIIYLVDGLHVTTSENFNAMCTGNIGDVIRIVVGRDADTVVTAVTLGEYKTPSVKLHYEDSIPVIEILHFAVTTTSDSGTYGEFISALQKTANAKSTIIDLRQNPGGETDQCGNAASELLSKGDTIIIDIEAFVDSVIDKGNTRYYQSFDTIVYTAQTEGIAKDRYYVLMASDTSASCAETFISAIAANKKSPIVGKLTYGKGIGQAVIQTEVGGGLALITALQGFDKNWESYHDLGIAPDYDITEPDMQMAKAVELAKEATALRTAGYGTKKLNHFSKTRVYESRNKLPNRNDLKLRYKMKNR